MKSILVNFKYLPLYRLRNFSLRLADLVYTPRRTHVGLENTINMFFTVIELYFCAYTVSHMKKWLPPAFKNPLKYEVSLITVSIPKKDCEKSQTSRKMATVHNRREIADIVRYDYLRS